MRAVRRTTNQGKAAAGAAAGAMGVGSIVSPAEYDPRWYHQWLGEALAMQDNSGVLKSYRSRISDLEARARELRVTDGKESEQLEGEAHALRLSLPDIMRSLSPEASEAEELAEQERYEEEERDREERYWEDEEED